MTHCISIVNEVIRLITFRPVKALKVRLETQRIYNLLSLL